MKKIFDENGIYLEIPYSFIKLSTAEVHLLDVPRKVGVSSIKKGLAMKDMDGENDHNNRRHVILY